MVLVGVVVGWVVVYAEDSKKKKKKEGAIYFRDNNLEKNETIPIRLLFF